MNETIRIADLKPAAYNPRRMGRHEGEALKRSLEEYGPVEPAVINADNTIIGGHMRIDAAKELGWEEFPIVRVDLPEDKARLLNLALNRIAGEWDEDKLAELIYELDDSGAELALSGFDTSEIDKLLDSVSGPMRDDDPELGEAPSDPVTKPGDLITFGGHCLLCGDATEPADLRRLMGDEQAAMIWTDPPYGVDYVGKTKDALTITGDSPEGIGGLLTDTFEAVGEHLVDGAAIYIAHPSGPLSVTFGQCVIVAGWRFHQTLIWVKDSIVLGHSDYHYRHEPVILAYAPSAGRRGRGAEGWYGDNSQDTIFEVPRPKASREHPTAKPVQLIAQHLRNSSRRDDLVLDPFAGSGPTLIAAEQLGRRAALMEISPAYCDVIVSRWEEFTGKEAVRERVETVA